MVSSWRLQVFHLQAQRLQVGVHELPIRLTDAAQHPTNLLADLPLTCGDGFQRHARLRLFVVGDGSQFLPDHRSEFFFAAFAYIALNDIIDLIENFYVKPD